jgi:cathepsin B
MRVHHYFFLYRRGIYFHTHFASRFYGLHAVRLLGWGEIEVKNTSVKYWLAVNSWSEGWGENGYFRIVRGKNECGIEEQVVAPIF